jgi:hypothetical protein
MRFLVRHAKKFNAADVSRPDDRNGHARDVIFRSSVRGDAP